MKNKLTHFHEDEWERGERGATAEFTRKVDAKRERAVDGSLDLQVISIRLQKELIEALKALAKEEGIGYQPYIRQLLTRHVRNKRQDYLRAANG